MAHTLAEAAKAAGRDRSTLLRAIRSGKLSASRDPATGAWLIEPAELHRVYAAQGNEQGNSQVRIGESEMLHREIELLRERLGEKDEVITDLRRRLDGEAEERRRLTALLIDQRPAPVPAQAVADPPPSPVGDSAAAALSPMGDSAPAPALSPMGDPAPAPAAPPSRRWWHLRRRSQ